MFLRITLFYCTYGPRSQENTNPGEMKDKVEGPDSQ